MAYIIDAYNKYDQWDRAHSIYKFTINENWYAVKQVDMVWGLPALAFKIDREDNPSSYHIWEYADDAIAFARHLKHLNS